MVVVLLLPGCTWYRMLRRPVIAVMSAWTVPSHSGCDSRSDLAFGGVKQIADVLEGKQFFLVEPYVEPRFYRGDEVDMREGESQPSMSLQSFQV